jgi:alpha,alpha-trehalose phosphorylase
MRFQGRIVHVEARAGKARYTLLKGDPLPIAHHGTQVTLGAETVAMDIPALEPLPAPFQPAGRAPQSRSPRD